MWWVRNESGSPKTPTGIDKCCNCLGKLIHTVALLNMPQVSICHVTCDSSHQYKSQVLSQCGGWEMHTGSVQKTITNSHWQMLQGFIAEKDQIISPPLLSWLAWWVVSDTKYCSPNTSNFPHPVPAKFPSPTASSSWLLSLLLSLELNLALAHGNSPSWPHTSHPQHFTPKDLSWQWKRNLSEVLHHLSVASLLLQC